MTADPYEVRLRPAARRALRRLDRPVQRRILDALTDLGMDPRPHGTKALVGGEGLLRIRIGDYRVVYEVQDDQLIVLVVTLGHRRLLYQGL